MSALAMTATTLEISVPYHNGYVFLVSIVQAVAGGTVSHSPSGTLADRDSTVLSV